MLSPLSPIPSIEISFAPPEDVPVEPYSPFNAISFQLDEPELDAPRSSHLLPPPVLSPNHQNSPKQSSPLRGSSGQVSGRGLDQARFESLLRSTRERNATKTSAVDLRKEVALKAHKNKQAERRALFLSKIEAPPSPSATSIPVTPPDSPAVLHYSLPSPGLVSPITLFESLQADEESDMRRVWIEQVDFKSSHQDWVEEKQARKEAILAPRVRRQPIQQKKSLPSLDQISARMSTQHGNQPGPRKTMQLPIGPSVPLHAPAARAPIPLPAFLRSRTSSQPGPTSPAAPARMSLPELPAHVRSRAPTPPPPPHPKFNVTTTILPSKPPSPDSTVATPLTAANLTLLESRNEKGKAMLEKILRRVSSPAELERAGKRKGEVFGEHHVLRLPGGF